MARGKARRQARRQKRKDRRAKRKERRERRKEMRMERKEKRLEGGTFFERLGTGIKGVVGEIGEMKMINEGFGDPLGVDQGYIITEQETAEKKGFDMEMVKQYWWVGAIALALFFFRKRLI